MWINDITNQSTKAILDGKLFCGGYIFTALANAGTAYFRVRGGSVPSFVDILVAASGKCIVTPYKGTTYSANGTAVSMNNRNLGSANTTSVISEYTPTINVLGASCAPILIPGSTGGGGGTGVRVGSGFNDDYGFLLPAGGDILFGINNTSGAAIDANVIAVVSELP